MSRTRLTYIDTARGFAISLALLSHFMLGSGSWDALAASDSGLEGLRAVTRVATPTFILLFGMSSEMAYVRRWREGHSSIISKKLVRRAVQCYIASVSVGLATAIGGVVSYGYFVKNVLLMAPVVYADIFVFYVFSLLLSLLMIPLRIKFGILPLFFLCISWWPIASIVKGLFSPPPLLDGIMSQLFGIGTGIGPSAFHAQALVVLGMALSAAIQDRSNWRKKFVVGLASALMVCGAVYAILRDGIFGALEGMSYAYRAENSFAYFCIGGTLAILILFLCWAASLTGFGNRGVGVFGRNSMQAFALGNIILALFIGHVHISNFIVGIGCAIIYVASFWVAFKVWISQYKSSRFRWLREIANGPERTERAH